MKINQIQIDGFGKWQDHQFTLNPGLQVIYGANEAGKSTLKNFIVGVLFGFADGRSSQEQYLPKNGAAYGGQIDLTNDDGIQYHLRRTAGKNGGHVELTDEHGRQVPASRLTELLDPLDLDLYQALLSFSQLDLSAIRGIGREELESNLQHMGAVGSGEWLKTAAVYEKNAGDLYKPTGRKPLLNQKLKEYDGLTDQIKAANQNYLRYHELMTQVADETTKLDQYRGEFRKADQAADQLTTLTRLWATYQQVKNHEAAVDQLQIDQADADQVTTLQANATELERQTSSAQSELQILQAADFTSDRQKFYFSHLNEFQTIATQIPSARQAAANHQRLATQIASWQDELTQIKAQYGEELPQPLNDVQRQDLEKLLKHQTELENQSLATNHSRTQSTNKPASSTSLIWLAMAVIGLLMAILFSGVGLRLLGVAFILGGLFGWYRNQSHSVVAPQPDPNDQALQQVSSQLTQFGSEHDLGQFPQSQWLTMQGELRRFAEVSDQLTQAFKDQQVAADELRHFRSELTPILDWLATDDLNKAMDQIQSYRSEQQDTAQKFATSQQKIKLLVDQISALKQRSADNSQQLAAIFAKYQVTDHNEFQVLQQHQQATAVENEKISAVKTQITDSQLQALSQYSDEQGLQTANEAAHTQTSQLKETISNLESSINRNQLELTQLTRDGELSSLRQQRADLETEINELAAQWLQHKLAAQWINQTLTVASRDRFPQIIRQAVEYFQQLTVDHFHDIRLVDDTIEVVDQVGESFSVKELSQGTAEQLYVALRFAFATVMNTEINFPMLIDDGFVNFDNHRKQLALELLNEISQHNQVLYFTADDRVLNMYNNKQIINLDEE